ncbi:YhdP family protein [Enterobacter hormaechei]
MRFDFSDTFSEGFYYDSIRSTAWIKDGVLHTDDTLVDGLEADIAMKGSVNLVRRELDMEAVVAPEISASVGVAAAFVVNPIVGAAVFAASKVLGPLWSKVSMLCAIALPVRSINRRLTRCCASRAKKHRNDLTWAGNCLTLNKYDLYTATGGNERVAIDESEPGK